MNYNDKTIVLKDFLNISDISVYEIIRKIDRLILLMADDVKNILNGEKEENFLHHIEQKEIDINKLCNLIFKVIKLAFNPMDRNTLKLTLDDIFYYWEMALFLEKIGDQIKRIPKSYKGLEKDEGLIKTYNKIMEQYGTTMKANYLKNVNLAIQTMINKASMFEELNAHTNRLPKEYFFVIEKMKMMNKNIGNIAMQKLLMPLLL